MNLYYRTLTLILCIIPFSFTQVIAQNNYQLGWEALNNKELEKAIFYFEKATKKENNKEKALLTLALIYSYNDENEKAANAFKTFYDISPDPFVELFAIWKEEGIIGIDSRKELFQSNLLNTVVNDSRITGKLDAVMPFLKGIEHLYIREKQTSMAYFDKYKALNKWQYLGPFDNVMNSGYDKDFGVLAHPEESFVFNSKFDTPIYWFRSDFNTSNGYVIKNNYVPNSSSQMYAQTFVFSETNQQVILKAGYSGNLKIWLNDEIVYTDPEHRTTTLDFHRYKCTLNKGYNRVLVQLGAYDEEYANFNVRFTDLYDQPLMLQSENKYMTYETNKSSFEKIPHFAIESLKAKVANSASDDPIYSILLANAYYSNLYIDDAEAILIPLIEKYPTNYLLLKQLILLNAKAGKTTEQNKYYASFEENYPNSADILRNKAKAAFEKKDKAEFYKYVGLYQEKFDNKQVLLAYKILESALEENIEDLSKNAEIFYQSFPKLPYAVDSYVNLQYSLKSDKKGAIETLEKYLQHDFNNALFERLLTIYIELNEPEKATALLQKIAIEFEDPYIYYPKIINIYSNQSKFQEIIEILKTLVVNRPSDVKNISDLAMVYSILGKKEEAINYYKKALEFSPYSVEIIDKIRTLKKQKTTDELIGKFDPLKFIKEYETQYKPSIKKPYDIILDQKTVFLFLSNATTENTRVIYKINDESAIESLQQVNLSPFTNYTSTIIEAQTIKKNGTKISAEQNGYDVVFTNLEIGDYIYYEYTQKQTDGGKSSRFFSDRFGFSSFYPSFFSEYTIFVEDGNKIETSFLNGTLQPQIWKSEGFKKYTWSSKNMPLLSEEAYAPPYNDIAQKLHLSGTYTWNDVVQWYKDLTETQIAPDNTIRQLVRELFQDKKYTEEEKAKVIYEFVCKNIQYSSIDFRQGSYIPQKASTVYLSRLGDCKDVSTLFVSMAREAGLDAHLVLINTRDNGAFDVVLPSLNFNHCIVKVNFNEYSKYLELTDPYLAYGQLNDYHYGAAILDIPYKTPTSEAHIERLTLQGIIPSTVSNTMMVTVDSNNELQIKNKALYKGSLASIFTEEYYPIDETERQENFKKNIQKRFDSEVTVQEITFPFIQQRIDSIVMDYQLLLKNETKKIGSFRTFKLPFVNILAENSILSEKERIYNFNFFFYENTDDYQDNIVISLVEGHSFIEIPENQNFSFNNNRYSLSFELIDKHTLLVKRTYSPIRSEITATEYKEFEAFLRKVIEAENTFVIYK